MLTRGDIGKTAKLSHVLPNTLCEVLQRLVPCEVRVAKKVQPRKRFGTCSILPTTRGSHSRRQHQTQLRQSRSVALKKASCTGRPDPCTGFVQGGARFSTADASRTGPEDSHSGTRDSCADRPETLPDRMCTGDLHLGSPAGPNYGVLAISMDLSQLEPLEPLVKPFFGRARTSVEIPNIQATLSKSLSPQAPKPDNPKHP